MCVTEFNSILNQYLDSLNFLPIGEWEVVQFDAWIYG